ncbi:hypothetical protein HDV02_003357 [Globomyces sp. JEL0801]|nr:hypothetical protein HDV02_003357 [Globomyces sp. JEL0801]
MDFEIIKKRLFSDHISIQQAALNEVSKSIKQLKDGKFIALLYESLATENAFLAEESLKLLKKGVLELVLNPKTIVCELILQLSKCLQKYQLLIIKTIYDIFLNFHSQLDLDPLISIRESNKSLTYFLIQEMNTIIRSSDERAKFKTPLESRIKMILPFINSILFKDPDSNDTDKLMTIHFLASVLNYVSTEKSQESIKSITNVLFSTFDHSQHDLNNFIQIEVLKILTKFLHSDVITNDVIFHHLLSRLIDIWSRQSIVDQRTLTVLTSIIQTYDATIDVYKITIVVSSSIMLDQPLNKQIFQLLQWSVNGLINSSYWDRIYKVAFLPIIACLMLPVAVLTAKDSYRQSVYNLLNVLETAKTNTPDGDIREMDPVDLRNSVYQLYITFTSFLNGDKISKNFTAIESLHTLLFSARLFSSNNQVGYKTLQYFNENILLYRKTDMLKVLSLYLYLIKRQRFQHYILTKSIPALCAFKDPFITNASLKITLQIIKPQQFVTVLELIGLECLIEIWKIQPRIWNHIKIYISNWSNRFKNSQGGGKIKPQSVIQKENELEIVVTKSILYFCETDPLKCGADLIPVIISLLKLSLTPDFGHTRNASFEATGYLLSSFNECIMADITSPRSDAKEKDVLFRTEILQQYLTPLLDHPNVEIQNEVYSALRFFPMDEILELIPSPAEFLEIFYKSSLPDAYASFLIKRIEFECLNMSRPVFKGLSSEPGAKVTKANLNPSRQLKGVDMKSLKNIADISKSLTKSFTSGAQINRSAYAMSILYYPYIEQISYDDQSSLNQLLSLILKDISITDSPLFYLDAIDAWQSFWCLVLTNLFKSLPTTTDDSQKVELMSDFFQRTYSYLFDDRLEKSAVPSTSSNIILSISSFCLAIFHLHFVPPTNFVQTLINRLLSKLKEPLLPLEVESSLLISLTYLATGLQLHDKKLIETIWSICLKPDQYSTDGVFAYGISVAKLLYQSSISMEANQTKLLMDQFLDRFFSTESGWNSLGAAIGFSMMLSIQDFPLKSLISDETLQSIMHLAINSLSNDAELDHMQFKSACWIISHSYRSSDESTDTINFEDVYERCKTEQNLDLLHHLSLAKLRYEILHSVDIAKIMDRIIENLNQNLNLNLKVATIYSLRILFGLDYMIEGQRGSYLPVSQILQLTTNCYNMLLQPNVTPKVSRALSLAIGAGLSTVYSTVHGVSTISGAIQKSGDPEDYRRLNPMSSYLKATYDSLKHYVNNGSLDLARKSLDVLININTTLPPVDWTGIFESFSVSEKSYLKCLMFSSKQVSPKSAKSLITTFIRAFEENSTLEKDELAELLLSDLGIGNLLKLGDSLVIKQVIAALGPMLTNASQNIGNPINLKLFQKISHFIKKGHVNVQSLFYRDLSAILMQIYLDLDMESICSALEFQNVFLKSISGQEPTRHGLWALAIVMPNQSNLSNDFTQHLGSLPDRSEIDQMHVVYALNASLKRCTLSEEQKLKWLIRLLDITILSASKNIPNMVSFYWLFTVLPSVHSLWGMQFILEPTPNWPQIQYDGILWFQRVISSIEGNTLQQVMSRLKTLHTRVIDEDCVSFNGSVLSDLEEILNHNKFR